MGNLFGRNKSKDKPAQNSRVTEADRAVLQLKQQRDKLKQYRKRLSVNLEKERQLAKALLQDGKREKAKLLLRKKKFQETLIAKTESQLDNIDQLVHDLEFAQIESQVLQGLKTGNESLKTMQQLVSIEEVEQLMDETAEAADFQRQISDLLSGGLSEDDESEVMDELNELLSAESEQVNLQLPDVPTEELFDEPTEELPAARGEPAERQSNKKQAVLAS